MYHGKSITIGMDQVCRWLRGKGIERRVARRSASNSRIRFPSTGQSHLVVPPIDWTSLIPSSVLQKLPASPPAIIATSKLELTLQTAINLKTTINNNSVPFP